MCTDGAKVNKMVTLLLNNLFNNEVDENAGRRSHVPVQND